MTEGAASGPSPTSTVAVVTTYHPEPGLADRLMSLAGQVGRILIVDNGSLPSEQVETRSLGERADIDVIWNGANFGLATALDQGLEWAFVHGAAWALLLDQDSQPERGIVAEAARVLGLTPPDKVAALGSGIVGRDHGGSPGSAGWREERAVITSGTFISVEAWRALGGFRRDLFVDYVDLEFCLRARAAGYRILRSLQPTIRHAIGRPVRHRLLWRTVTATHHDRARRYSMTRNRVYVWRTYGRHEPGFVAADAWGFAKEFLKVVLFERDRAAKVGAIAAGIRDGFLRLIPPG
jgi:rhamnosyltransferase